MCVKCRKDTDSSLVEEFLNGTLRSESVEYFLERMVRMLKPTGRFQRQEAHDIALATLEEVCDSIHAYQGTSAFFTWVTTIARRVAYDHRKRQAKIEIVSGAMVHTDFPIETNGTHPERQVIYEVQVRERQEEQARLRLWICRDALHMLDESERRLVELRIYQELSLGEIGELLGVSADAVQHRLARIWSKMRRHLDDDSLD